VGEEKWAGRWGSVGGGVGRLGGAGLEADLAQHLVKLG